MTSIGDLLGSAANELLQSSINVGDVYLLSLIIEAVKESPTINRKQLKDFGII